MCKPESPCVGVCTLDPATGQCMGCHRTAQEIEDWYLMSAEEKRAVLEELKKRA